MTITPGIYTHYKSPDKSYEVIGIAYSKPNMEPVVVYKALYPIPELGGDDIIFTRSLDNFCEEVEHNGILVPRFTRKEA